MYGGTSAISIGITMFLKDQFTGPARRIKDQSTELGRVMNELAKQKDLRNLYAGKAFMGAATLYGMGRVINKGAEFGYTMKTMGIITKATSEQIAGLNTQAKELGTNTMFYAQEVALAMQKLAKADFNANQIKQSIDASVYLAGASGETLESSTEVINRALQTFNIPFAQSMKVADMVTSAVLGANIELFDYAESLKYVGATARDLNMSLEETSAAIMVLGNAGIKGSMAGTALENMLRYIAMASGRGGKHKQAVALNALGLTPAQLMDVKGNLLPISDILKNFVVALKGMGTAQRQNVLQEIFGVRGKRAASILARNLEDYDSFVKALVGSEGRAKEITETRMDTLYGQIDILKESFKTLGITFTEAISPWLTPLLKGINAILSALNDFMGTWAGKAVTRILAFGLAIKTVMWAAKAIMAGFKVVTLTNMATFLQYQAQTVAGYQSMSAAAATYNTVAGGGIAQNVGWNMGAGRRMPGFVGKMNSPYYYHKNAGWMNKATGRFASASAVSQFQAPFIAGMAYNPAGTVMSRGGGRFLASGVAQSMTTTSVGASRGIFGMLGGIGNLLGGLTRVLGFLGRFLGPIGLVVSLVGDMFGWWDDSEDESVSSKDVQYQIEALNKNTLELENNTASLVNLNEKNAIGMAYAQDLAITKAIKEKYLANPSKGMWYDFAGDPDPKRGTHTKVEIYMDGKRAIDKAIEKGNSESLHRKFGMI